MWLREHPLEGAQVRVGLVAPVRALPAARQLAELPNTGGQTLSGRVD